MNPFNKDADIGGKIDGIWVIIAEYRYMVRRKTMHSVLINIVLDRVVGSSLLNADV